MKHVAILAVCLLALTSLAFDDPPAKLVGRWQMKAPPGQSLITAYRSDGTFDVFVNKKILASGTYKLSKDTLLISDPTCGNGYYGQYRLAFITTDSVSQVYLQDSCTARRETIVGSPTMGRIKATKP